MDFTRKFPREVAGLVFVDASHPDQIARQRAAKIPGGRAAFPVHSPFAYLNWTGATRLRPGRPAHDRNVPPGPWRR